MSFKSRPQQNKKTVGKRKWHEGDSASDTVAYCYVSIFSIAAEKNLDKGQFSLTGMIILVYLL